MFDPQNLIFKTSTIHDGNMSLEYGERDEVKLNRDKFLVSSKYSMSDCVVMQLEHSDTIKIVDNEHRGIGARDPKNGPICDALITQTPGVLLFMLTADCLPISFYDSTSNTIALAHLSWKNTSLELSKKVVKELETFGSDPQNIYVYVGPCIRKESYIKKDPEQLYSEKWQSYLYKQKDGRFAIDLVSYNIDQLLEVGLRPEHIEDVGIDTGTDTNYFSHCRSVQNGEPEGRIATILGIR